MSYLVLARKTRPNRFSEVVAQPHIVQAIQNAIQLKRLPHALLLCGSRGLGKTSIARIIAKTINCLNPQSEPLEPCCECDLCIEITEGRSVDVFEIDGASNRSIDDIRELRDGVKYLPNRGKRKVYIIDEVHMLTREAFNALLKTLEEPPEHVLFLFATTEPHKIPVTILSRCQRFDFKKPSIAILCQHIERVARKEGILLNDESLAVLARSANGGLRDAMSLLDQVIAFAGEKPTTDEVAQAIGAISHQYLLQVGKALFHQDVTSLLQAVDEIFLYAYDLRLCLQELCQFLRNLLVIQVCEKPEEVCDLTSQEIQELRQLAASTSPHLIQQMFRVLTESAEEIARSPHPRLYLEMTLIRLSRMEPVRPIEDLLQQLSALEHRLLQESPDGKENLSAQENPSPEKKKKSEPTLSIAIEKKPSEPTPSFAIEKKSSEPVSTPIAKKPVQSEEKNPIEEKLTFGKPLPTLELTSEQFLLDWERLLDQLEEEDAFLSHRLAGAQVALRENNVLELAFEKEMEKKLLDSKEKIQSIEFFLKAKGFPLQLKVTVLQGNQQDFCQSVLQIRKKKQERLQESMQQVAMNHPLIQEFLTRVPQIKITEVHPIESDKEDKEDNPS